MSLQERSFSGGPLTAVRASVLGSSLSRTVRRHPVTLPAVTSAAIHLLFLSRSLGEDEGGFALVGRVWSQPGPYLYGPQWVDRPPVLILVFAIGDHLGPYGIRLVETGVATVLVIAAGYAAGAVRGRRAAGWAALAALAFSSSTLMQAEQLNGEPVAAMFVMVSMALLLHAGYTSASTRTVTWLAVGSGAAAAAAVFSKQDFVDGLVFAFVLWVVGTLQRRTSRAFAPDRGRPIALGYLAGALALTGAVLGWAWSAGRLGALLYAMYGFRADAAAVMARWSFNAPMHRLDLLLALALVSGLGLLAGLLALGQLRRPTRRGPVAYALAAAFAVELLGVLAGGSYWSHYLLALVPTVALASGLVAASPRSSSSGWRSNVRWTRALVVLSLLVTVVRLPWAFAQEHVADSSYTIGTWIGASAAPGDTAGSLFTHGNLIQATGLTPVYPYSWSLPIRTLDPHLDLLVSTLDGPRAPTWFVTWDNFQLWGMDPQNRVLTALRTHYVQVARFGGKDVVWLHDGQPRQLAPLPGVAAASPAHPSGASGAIGAPS